MTIRAKILIKSLLLIDELMVENMQNLFKTLLARIWNIPLKFIKNNFKRKK